MGFRGYFGGECGGFVGRAVWVRVDAENMRTMTVEQRSVCIARAEPRGFSEDEYKVKNAVSLYS